MFPHEGASLNLKYTQGWEAPELFSGRGQGGQLRASLAIDVFALGLVAGLILDKQSFPEKTVLPSNDADLERALTDQAYLHSLLPCDRTHRHGFKEMVHQMCRLDPAERPSVEGARRLLARLSASRVQEQLETEHVKLQFVEDKLMKSIEEIRLDEQRVLGEMRQVREEVRGLRAEVSQSFHSLGGCRRECVSYLCRCVCVLLPSVSPVVVLTLGHS
jgi:hypothetical protein